MRLSRATRAHPRSRGEHNIKYPPSLSVGGSSPLARGTHFFGGDEVVDFWLIPARAGNTVGRLIVLLAGGAHPRSRGEHVSSVSPFGWVLGSSPLARGTLSFPFVGGRCWGLIPARAGNTCCILPTFRCRRAHPRSRGEHEGVFAKDGDDAGSSPLARGTLLDDAIERSPLGLIPARAGNTNPGSRPCLLRWAHPRSRGEHRYV